MMNNMIAPVVYILCMITSLGCAVMLLKSYRQRGVGILLWSGLCFIGFALNNALLLVDYGIGGLADLSVIRTIPAFVGVSLLLYGLITETSKGR
jgi:hypothetical protein